MARDRTIPGTRAARRRFALLPTVLLGTSLLAGPAAGPDRVPIAVIVHPRVPVEELSLAELRQIFLGERHSWSDELTITLLMPPRGSPERRVLLNKIYERHSEVQYQQYWINKLFDGAAPIAPKITGSDEMSASLVREIPGAIALVPANRIPPGVKVLRIDGKRPGDSGYGLR